MVVVILGLVMFVPVVQAERQEIRRYILRCKHQYAAQATPGQIYVGAPKVRVSFRAHKPYFENYYHASLVS